MSSCYTYSHSMCVLILLHLLQAIELLKAVQQTYFRMLAYADVC
jgi:hypothetical protein